jgi:hypothetical protein
MKDMTLICIAVCMLGMAAIACGLGMLAWDVWQWCKRHRKPKLKAMDAYNGEWH